MLKRILLTAALIGACFFPKVVLVAGDIGTDPIRLGAICHLYIFFSILYFIYKRRDIPFYGKLWTGISIFFAVLFATLLGGYIKEKWKQKEYGSALFAFMVPLLWFINKIEKSEKQLNK
ncbi:MAG: hypothetical protein WD512_04670 [Candidatus Paceibacterota bacterium]